MLGLPVTVAAPVTTLVLVLWRALGLAGLGLDGESGVGGEGKRGVVRGAGLDESSCDGVGRGRVESLWDQSVSAMTLGCI